MLLNCYLDVYQKIDTKWKENKQRGEERGWRGGGGGEEGGGKSTKRKKKGSASLFWQGRATLPWRRRRRWEQHSGHALECQRDLSVDVHRSTGVATRHWSSSVLYSAPPTIFQRYVIDNDVLHPYPLSTPHPKTHLSSNKFILALSSALGRHTSTN